MRPLRFPGRFRWWIVAVLAVIFGFPLFPLAAWLAWEMPPLQRYYLLNYLESTERAKQPRATTEVQWVYKTATGRKSTLATNPDVVSENSADPPVRLSAAAIADGWTGIEKHAPVHVDSVQLEQFLQEDIYNGRGYWRLMLEPILLGFALILFLIAGGLQLKEFDSPLRSRLIVVSLLPKAARKANGNSAPSKGWSARADTAASISTAFIGPFT